MKHALSKTQFLRNLHRSLESKKHSSTPSPTTMEEWESRGRAGGLLDKMGNQPNWQEAHENGVEPTAEVGDKRALAACQGRNREPRHFFGCLYIVIPESAGVS